MFSYHIYPVLHLLSWKSTLYPSFLLSSFVFFPLRNMLLFYVWSCLKSHLFYPHHLLCSFLMPFISATLLWMVLLFLLLLWILLWSFSCFSIWTLCLAFFSFSLCWLHAKSLPSSTLFYMFCRWICGSFFLFALFHFLCRAVVQSAEALSPQPRGPVHHGGAVGSCLRPRQHPGLMLLTPL